MTPEQLDELDARRAAYPEGDWDGVQVWLDRAYELTRPGGVLAVALPDGKPFVATKPRTATGPS